MAARRVIDHFAAAARGMTLEAGKLRYKTSVVEKLSPVRVQKRQHVEVYLAPRLFGRLVGDPINRESLARPLAGVMIARNRRDSVALENARKFTHHVFRTEGRLDFPNQIKNGSVDSSVDNRPKVSDRERHRICASAGRIDEGVIVNFRNARKFRAALEDARFDCLARDEAFAIGPELGAIF